MEVIKIDENGIYNPYELDWDATIEFPSTRTVKQYGNRIYNRYPARSVFLVPRSIIAEESKRNSSLNILDPFMGSGTTAVEASLVPNTTIFGTEMDPFARLIAQVSIQRFTYDELSELDEHYNFILSNWKSTQIDQSLYPNLKNIEYWFDENVFQELMQLKSCIYNFDVNEKKSNFFKICFADCIKPASKMERQSTKPYISSKYKKTPKPVWESFEYSFGKFKEILEDYIKDDKKHRGNITWLSFDATNFEINDVELDLAITSPPYLNAFDYTHIIKIESAWVGTLVDKDVSILRSKQVGHAKRADQEIDALVYKHFNEFELRLRESMPNKKIGNERLIQVCLAYFNDMLKNLKCVHNALRKGGSYHMIIGDNVINKIEIPTHIIIANLAQEVGFNWKGYYKYPIKDHRTSVPRGEQGGKIKYEFVLILEKEYDKY